MLLKTKGYLVEETTKIVESCCKALMQEHYSTDFLSNLKA